MDILLYFIQNLNLDKLVLKVKSHQVFLKICIRVNVLSCFWQFGPKFKTLTDLLENLHSTNLEGAECRSEMDILQHFIQNLNLSKLVLKVKSCQI